ncbi:hypothetical protein AHAS_Ahas02G0136300 [Arachis hypogaea]
MSLSPLFLCILSPTIPRTFRNSWEINHTSNIPQRHQGRHHQRNLGRRLASWLVKGTIHDSPSIWLCSTCYGSIVLILYNTYGCVVIICRV